MASNGAYRALPLRCRIAAMKQGFGPTGLLPPKHCRPAHIPSLSADVWALQGYTSRRSKWTQRCRMGWHGRRRADERASLQLGWSANDGRAQEGGPPRRPPAHRRLIADSCSGGNWMASQRGTCKTISRARGTCTTTFGRSGTRQTTSEGCATTAPKWRPTGSRSRSRARDRDRDRDLDPRLKLPLRPR